MKNLRTAPLVEFRSPEEIDLRIRALEKTLEGAKQTTPNFTKDDQALRIYLNVINARIQELKWVRKESKLFIIKHNRHEQRND